MPSSWPGRLGNHHYRRGRKRGEKPRNLLIEEISRPRYARAASLIRKSADHDFFTTLSAQRNVSRAFLFRKRRVNAVLPSKEFLRRSQRLCRIERCRGFLESSGAL